MMNPIDKLRKLLQGDQLENDGSKELAEGWLELLNDSQEMQGLLANKTFQSILGRMEKDFLSRMNQLVESDPELRATKRMFIRTIGLRGAEERIQKLVIDYLEEPT